MLSVIRLGLIVCLVLCDLFLIERVSWAKCNQQLAKIAEPSTTQPTDLIPKWSFKERNLTLTPQQIFPKEFLKEIEEKKGPVHIQVQFSLRDSSLKIKGSIKDQPYFKVRFLGNNNFPEKLLIDGLLVENPLAEGSDRILNSGQKAKGVSFSDFRYMTGQIFEVAKAGGYKEAFTTTQQHFAVTMLYKKLLGMEPTPGAGAELFSELEKIYLFARKELPVELRPKDVREFTEMLGSAGSVPSGLTTRRLNQLAEYFHTGQLDPSIKIFRDKEGKPICAYFSDKEKAKGKMVFIYQPHGRPQVLQWSEITMSRSLALTKKL